MNKNYMRDSMNIQIIKRSGRKEPLKMEKVLTRIERQAYKLDANYVQPFEVAKKVIDGIYDGVTTRELDNLSIETAASMTSVHPDYAILAARLAISTLHKDTSKSFSETTEKLYNFVNPETGSHAPLVSKEYYDIVMKNKDIFDGAIAQNRDDSFDYFGFKTLEKSYLLKVYDEESKQYVVAERPQYLFMRTAIGIHGEDIDSALRTYDLISEGFFTHATPTLFNAGTTRPQLASCFLLQMKDDSIDGIFDTAKEVAKISKNAGGIGISVSNIRASGSYITGTNGKSNGLVPMLRVFDNIARYVDQGGGKRKGSFAMYIEPWHADVFDFLDLKKNHGKEEVRARDLFYALWMPDLFMQRVEKDEMWSLMCPNECPGLQDAYAEDFVELYEKYEAEGKFRKQVKARELWAKVLESQMETGTPYIAYKDSCNVKSNQKNLGTLKNSNLCIEILEYVAPDETAVCNLASLALPKFIKGRKNKKFDYDKLEEVAYQATVNLNKVIDVNYYPVESAKKSNMRHRPIGLGTQGLADVFFLLGLEFGSDKSKEINKKIYETIYYAALKASNDIAKVEGSYKTFKGSPASKGILQFDMWGVTPSDRYDWDGLRESIKKHGLRNSLTTCAMPTASTASIFGNEASIEAQTSNIYTRRVLSGEFVIVNKHLVRELCELNLWDSDMKDEIIVNNGSVQGINKIPEEVQKKYKTVWEISQKDVIEMSADRGAYIDQTQSLNIFMANPNAAKLTSMHFYGWGGGVTKDLSIERTREEINARILELEEQYELFMSHGESIPETIELDGDEPTTLVFGDIVTEIDGLKQKLEDTENWHKYGSTPEKALKTGMYYLRSKSATNAVKFSVDVKKQDGTVEEYSAEDAVSCSLDSKEGECLACGS
jgi:ribonucleoside-diphosphate reductase alpha subunit